MTLGGLGRFIYDGLAQQDYGQMISGGLLVAALALVADLMLALVQRYTVSPGISGRADRQKGVDSRVAVITEELRQRTELIVPAVNLSTKTCPT